MEDLGEARKAVDSRAKALSRRLGELPSSTAGTGDDAGAEYELGEMRSTCIGSSPPHPLPPGYQSDEPQPEQREGGGFRDGGLGPAEATPHVDRSIGDGVVLLDADGIYGARRPRICNAGVEGDGGSVLVQGGKPTAR